MAKDDRRRLVPHRKTPQRVCQTGDETFRDLDTGFEMQRLHLEDPILSVRLRIDSADKSIAVEDGSAK